MCNKQHQSLLANCFMLVSCMAYFSTLKMETRCSSETSSDFHLTAERYVLDDATLQYQSKLLWPLFYELCVRLVPISSQMNVAYSSISFSL
jgi:hypothetical protein